MSALAYRQPLWRQVRDQQPLWFDTTLLFVVLTMLTLVLQGIDERLFNGVNVWTKPFKFSLSLAVYYATLLAFVHLLPSGYLNRPIGILLVWASVICGVFEIAYIIWQAAQAEPSHFNVGSPFHAMMYGLMGIGAVTLVVVCAWLGIVILKSSGLNDVFAFSAGVGLILTMVLGGGFGGYLAAQTSHWVNASPTDANGVWLFNWARDGGDLRVAHFFGMHAMQILPLVAWPLRHKTTGTSIALIVAAAVALSAFTTTTFVQAVDGRPFMS